MKIVKSLDYQGRIVVPREALLAAGLVPGSQVVVDVGRTKDKESAVIIYRFDEHSCLICKQEIPELTEFRVIGSKKICKKCLDELSL
jgi:bifunctional DNA-binding transcriptional regulator/antitoxin component of YhaV-PrlF toxin-antitoxin module